MSNKAEPGYCVIPAKGLTSGEPCTIEVNEIDGDFVLRTVHKGTKTTMAAVLSDDALRQLRHAINSYLDPINGQG